MHKEIERQKEERHMVTKTLAKEFHANQHFTLSYADQLNQMEARQANKIKLQITQLFYQADSSEADLIRCRELIAYR